MSDDARPQLIEVHLEELGQHSWWKALLTTLGGSYGSAQYRFVARPVGSPDEERSHVAMSSTFPWMRLADLDDTTTPEQPWLPIARERLEEIDAALVERGWRRLDATGEHWWSRRYETTPD